MLQCGGPVKDIKFCASSQACGIRVEDSRLEVWAIESRERKAIINTAGLIITFAVSSSMNRIVAATDRAVELYELEAGECIGFLEVDGLHSVELCGNRIAVGRRNTTPPEFVDDFSGGDLFEVEIYDGLLKAAEITLTLPEELCAWGLEYCSEKNTLGTALVGTSVWDLENCTILWHSGEFDFHRFDEAGCMCISQDGSTAAIGWGSAYLSPERVTVVDAMTGELKGWCCEGNGDVESVYLSPEGRFLLVNGENYSESALNPSSGFVEPDVRYTRMIDLSTGRQLYESKNIFDIAALSPDASYMLTCSPDQVASVAIWEPPSIAAGS
jgi:WD40 repeat protein